MKSTLFCPSCSICFDIAQSYARCPDCALEAPAIGWPTLPNKNFPYLGLSIDGRFRVKRFLTDGTSGDVYELESPLECTFAGRFIDFDDTPSEKITRHIREFRQHTKRLNNLRNPHFATPLDVIEVSPSVFAIVTGYVHGTPLRVYLETQNQNSINRALNHTRQAAIALMQAHRIGLFHGDLRPSNIVIEDAEGKGSFVRILDFGLGQLLGNFDLPKKFLQTPLYSAPEIRADRKHLNEQIDIYSLGAILFHCLTGRPPFPATEISDYLPGAITTPSSHLQALRTDIPDDLANLISRMLESDPENRPKDLQEVIDRIDLISRPNTKPKGNGFAPPQLGLGAEETSAQYAMSDALDLDSELSVATQSRARTFAETCSKSSTTRPRLESPGFLRNITATYTKSDGIYCACWNGEIHYWGDSLWKKPVRVGKLHHIVLSITSGGPNILLIGTASGALLGLNTVTGEYAALLKRKNPLRALAGFGTRSSVLLEYAKGRVGVWNYETGEKASVRPCGFSPISLSVCPGGTCAAALSETGIVEIFNLSNGELYFRTKFRNNLIAIEFAKDNLLYGMNADGKKIKIWAENNCRLGEHVSLQ